MVHDAPFWRCWPATRKRCGRLLCPCKRAPVKGCPVDLGLRQSAFSQARARQPLLSRLPISASSPQSTTIRQRAPRTASTTRPCGYSSRTSARSNPPDCLRGTDLDLGVICAPASRSAIWNRHRCGDPPRPRLTSTPGASAPSDSAYDGLHGRNAHRRAQSSPDFVGYTVG